MDFRTALARNRPPGQLGPVRLSYADSCLLLDVAQAGRSRALAEAARWLGLCCGVGALALLLQPVESVGAVAPALLFASAACVGWAAWWERPPGYHRWALLFGTEELVLERRGQPLRPARAERLHFDQVTGLSVEDANGGRRLALRYEDASGQPREAVLLAQLRPEDGGWCAELVERLAQMLGLTSAGVRPARPPPSRTSGPAAPPASG